MSDSMLSDPPENERDEGSPSLLSPKVIAIGLLIGGGLLLLNGLGGSGGSGPPPSASTLPAAARQILTDPTASLPLPSSGRSAKAGKVMDTALDSAEIAAEAAGTGARVMKNGFRALESFTNPAAVQSLQQQAPVDPDPAAPSTSTSIPNPP